MIKLILDTDLGCDCDDAGAMAVMHHLADAGECEILAVTQCTSRRDGADGADAINRYFGRGGIPVGTWLHPGFLDGPQYGGYTRALAEKFPHRFGEGADYEDATITLRRALAAAEDGSVSFCTIGQLNNATALLRSGPDEISPLTGTELVAAKVAELSVMGGDFAEERHPEFNIVEDIPAARYLQENWPSPIVYMPYELGIPVKTGGKLLAECGEDNPVCLSYKVYNGGKPRESWDLLTVLYAVRGLSDIFAISEPGTVTFDGRGMSFFVPTPGGRDRVLRFACEAVYAQSTLDDLIVG